MKNWKSIKQSLIKTFNKRLSAADRKPDREFRSPKGYLTHEYLNCLKQMAFFEHETNDIWRGLAFATLGMIDLAIEPYYISDEILSSLINTDLPDLSYPFQEISPFLEAYLPSGALLDDEGDSVVSLIVVDHILWKQMARDDQLKQYWKKEKIDYRYGVYGLCEHGGIFYAPVLNNQDLNPTAEGELVISGGRVTDVLQSIKSIGLNLMILLQEYPEYITVTAPPLSSGGSGFGKSKNRKKIALHPPRIIGCDFNVRAETDSDIQLSQAATLANSGNTKTPHFRRGHWRRRRTGQGLRNHRHIWIRPKYINCSI